MTTMVYGGRARSHLGYTIDQTILIVAVIAILITLIIASVGWDLLNRTGGTKLASYLRQVEDATGTFYARNGLWPDDALDQDSVGNDPELNVRLLQQRDTYSLTTGRLYDKHQNLLPGFEDLGAGTGGLQHNFGPGGPIYMERATFDPASFLSTSIQQGTYFLVEFENVPVSEAQEADEAIDGKLDATGAAPEGRVVVLSPNAGAADCLGALSGTGGTVADYVNDRTVDVCYIGNLIN